MIAECYLQIIPVLSRWNGEVMSVRVHQIVSKRAPQNIRPGALVLKVQITVPKKLVAPTVVNVVLPEPTEAPELVAEVLA